MLIEFRQLFSLSHEERVGEGYRVRAIKIINTYSYPHPSSLLPFMGEGNNKPYAEHVWASAELTQ